MNYYEIIIDNEFIGVGTSGNMIRYQEKHNILLACTESSAQYIMCNDVLYHADWMYSVNENCKSEYKNASVIAIEEDTYNSLVTAIENNETIELETEDEVEEEQIVYEEGEEATLEYILSSKIAEMNSTCNSVITAGFDVVLSDGESHHFSLTTQDQLNLITLSSIVANGEAYVPYHADDELCKYYSAEDITTIVNTATVYKTYHTSYYNSLKAYIKSMTDIAEISAVYYGIEIPTDYQSEVLASLNS